MVRTIAVKMYADVLFLQIKDIKVNKSILMAPPERETRDSNIENEPTHYYLAQIIPEKILQVLYIDKYKFMDESLNEEAKICNSKTGWTLTNDGKCKMTRFFIERNKNNKPNQFSYKEHSEEFSIEIFVDENGNNPYIVEFDTESAAILYGELKKNEYYAIYDKGDKE